MPFAIVKRRTSEVRHNKSDIGAMQAGLLPPCKGSPNHLSGEVLTKSASAATAAPIGVIPEQSFALGKVGDTMTRGCERLEPRLRCC